MKIFSTLLVQGACLQLQSGAKTTFVFEGSLLKTLLSGRADDFSSEVSEEADEIPDTVSLPPSRLAFVSGGPIDEWDDIPLTQNFSLPYGAMVGMLMLVSLFFMLTVAGVGMGLAGLFCIITDPAAQKVFSAIVSRSEL